MPMFVNFSILNFFYIDLIYLNPFSCWRHSKQRVCLRSCHDYSCNYFFFGGYDVLDFIMQVRKVFPNGFDNWFQSNGPLGGLGTDGV